MAEREVMGPDLAILVDHMFDRVLEAPERAQLLSWIEAWEAANPDVDNAHRITGWIDVAYAFQAGLDRQAEVRDRVHTFGWVVPTWAWGSATA